MLARRLLFVAIAASTVACSVWFALADPYGTLDAGKSEGTDASSDVISDVSIDSGCASSIFDWNDASTCFTEVPLGASAAAITTYNDNLYVLDLDGVVSICSSDCTPPPKLIVKSDSGLDNADHGLAVSDAGIAWGGPLGLHTLLGDASVSSYLQHGRLAHSVVLRGKSVVWADDDNIYYSPNVFLGSAGGAPTTLYDAGLNGLALVGKDALIFWANDDTPYAAELVGSALEYIDASKDNTAISAVASTSTTLYWAAGQALYTWDGGGNVPGPGGATAANQPITAIGVANGFIYLADDSGGLSRCAIGSCNAPSDIVRVVTGVVPNALTIRANTIAVTSQALYLIDDGGRLLRLRL